MKKRKPVEEMVRIVREAEALLAGGTAVEEVCRQLAVTDSTLTRWRHKYGGLSTAEGKRLKELERENGRLKRTVADLTLEKTILQEAVRRLGKI